MSVLALEPTEVDGSVTVEVNRSEPIWSITVTNHSAEILKYEMMGKVPRGLGLELWDLDNEHGGIRIHAENLADYLNIDGFPADIREIGVGKSETFQFNPKSTSTTDDRTQLQWQRAKDVGYYQCRVFFGVYASRMMNISRADKAKKKKHPEAELAWLSDVLKKPQEEELTGILVRRFLNERNRSIVHWNTDTRGKDEYLIRYTTCAKADLDRMEPWDGSSPLEMALHDLVSRAQVVARKKDDAFRFSSLTINTCRDASTKHYVSVLFESDDDDVIIEFLLNGAPLQTTYLRLTQKQYDELYNYGIP